MKYYRLFYGQGLGLELAGFDEGSLHGLDSRLVGLRVGLPDRGIGFTKGLDGLANNGLAGFVHNRFGFDDWSLDSWFGKGRLGVD